MVIMPKGHRGFSLIELVVTITVLAILATAILPMKNMAARRAKEIELRRNLRIIRIAIDDYKKAHDKAVADNKVQNVVNKSSGCPETLQRLVEGEDFGGLSTVKRKFLRRIPRDPFNPYQGDVEDKMWGLHSSSDKPDSTSWGGEDVYDVYSLSEGKAIDGTNFKDW
ncbi:MAG TPA: type II secretion system protein [Desulfuromonadaceae bacterium]